MVNPISGFLQNIDKGSRRHFIQPLALALVFVLFAVLFFVTAMMDLWRLEGLLMDALRKRADYVVDMIEKASREKYSRLTRDGEEYRDLSTGAIIDDQAFSLQEALVGTLIDLARHIDLEEEQSGASESKIKEWATSEHIGTIGIFNAEGEPALRSAPLPPDIITQIQAMVKNNEEITIRLFHEAKARDLPPFVAVRKQSGKGAVVLVLDRDDIEHWGWRIATQAAVEELRWGTGIAYLSVEDTAGQTLARFGEIAGEKVEVAPPMAGPAGKPGEREGKYVKVGGTRYLELSFTFQLSGNAMGTARVGLETHETDQLLAENRKRIFLWTGLMVLVGLFAMGVLYRTQNRHVSRMQAMRERLYQAERLSALGKLGAGVAHEVRNPLNAISMAAQRLQREFVPTESDKKEKFERISYIVRDEIKRLNKIIEDFLSLSRSNRMEFHEQPLDGLLDRIFFLAREEAEPRGIHVEKRRVSPPPKIRMDAGKMEQALLNIIRNALESISGEGSITISCEMQGKDRIGIGIKDTGGGIPAGEEKRIFDPFYTCKETGVGLGLTIAHEIVLAHGGEIRVSSETGKGSTFEVLLPLLP